MIKQILLVALIVSKIAYAVTASQLTTPGLSSDGGTQIRASQTALDLDCWTFPAWQSVSGATKITVRVTTSAGTNFGIAIYAAGTEGGDSGSAVASGTTTTAAGYRTITVSSFNLTAGTLYRWCTCSDSAGFLLAGNSNTTNASTLDQIINSKAIRAGKGGNSCNASAVPPSTTGTLSTIASPSLWGFPFITVE